MHAIVEPLSEDEAIIVMRRTMDAPRELVWKAFTTPKHVMQWYGGHGFTNPVCEMDVRPGGRWHHVMRTPDGTEFTFDFVFLEVVKPERLVWQNADNGKRKAGGPPTCVNTMMFKDLGDKTEWQLVARFNSIAERDAASQMGFTEMVDQGQRKTGRGAKDALSNVHSVGAPAPAEHRFPSAYRRAGTDCRMLPLKLFRIARNHFDDFASRLAGRHIDEKDVCAGCRGCLATPSNRCIPYCL